MPQSPRTRIKTIVGKERAERRDNCEVIENRMAISDYQNGVSEGKKHQSPKTPKENSKNKENQSPYSSSPGSLDAPAPPKPPRSPRIERSVLGDSPTINKMNNLTGISTAPPQVSGPRGEESQTSERRPDSMCGEATSSGAEKTTENIYENCQNLVHDDPSGRNYAGCSADSSVCASPSDKLGRSCPDSEGTTITLADDEGRSSNKVLEEHLIRNIQDTLNIDVSLDIHTHKVICEVSAVMLGKTVIILHRE